MQRRNFLQSTLAALVPVAVPAAVRSAESLLKPQDPVQLVISNETIRITKPWDLTNMHVKDCHIYLTGEHAYFTGKNFVIERCHIHLDNTVNMFNKVSHCLINSCHATRIHRGESNETGIIG